MCRTPWWAAVLLVPTLLSCKEEEPPPPVSTTCDGVETEVLSSVPVTDWPAGLSAGVDGWQDYDGVYDIEQCGEPTDTMTAKITTYDFQQLLVETAGLPPDAPCGCGSDPDYGWDESLNPVGYAPDLQVFFDDFGDPAVDFQTVFMPGVFFAEGSDLQFRACLTWSVDPVLQSAYTSVTAIVRLAPDGTPSGTLLLEGPEGSKECVMGNWIQTAR